MSHVSGIVIIASRQEEGDEERPDFIVTINAWLAANHGVVGAFKVIDDKFGGGKHPQLYVIGSGLNALPEDAFVDFFRSLHFVQPEDVMMILKTEDQPLKIVRGRA